MLRWPVDPVRAVGTQTLPPPGRTAVTYGRWRAGG
jgi:hypothetical protein